MEELGIPEFFKGKTLFITGGSGFIGKVLIEKLLRSCPGIERIYVLIRERRGRSIQERIDDIGKLPLFDILYSERPEDYTSKVHPINGDVSLVNLGLSAEDRKLLINQVHIVYHVAATVKFDQALSDAILLNIRGTREVCSLSLQMKKIVLMAHVSTAYAHTEYNPIEEKMYPANADWKKCIAAAENMDPYNVSQMQGHMLGPYPNTYTYTKGLAERVVYDMLDGKVANIIIRPSIVVCTWKDPVPGWIDNFNGPVGMMAANGTGLVRINLIKNQTCDFVPVDLLVRAFLNVTWYRLTQEHDHKIPLKATSVHNCSANNLATLTTYKFAQLGCELSEELPLSVCVWPPSLRMTENQTWFNFVSFFLHVLPALFYDFLLALLRYPPVVLTIQRRIFIAVNALKFFILNEWKIVNTSVYSLEGKLLEKDMDQFGYNADHIDHREFFRVGISGYMKYLLKEDFSKLEFHRRKYKILKYANKILTVLLYAYFSYLFFIKWNVPGATYGVLEDYIENIHEELSARPT